MLILIIILTVKYIQKIININNNIKILTVLILILIVNININNTDIDTLKIINILF